MTTTNTTPPFSTSLTIGTTAATFRPLTVADRCDFEAWARNTLLAHLAEQPGVTAEALIAAGQAAIGIGWNSPEVIGLACSQRGATHLIWLATRKSHSLTPAQVVGQITDDQLHAGTRLLIDSFSMPAGVNRLDATQPPTQPGSAAGDDEPAHESN